MVGKNGRKSNGCSDPPNLREFALQYLLQRPGEQVHIDEICRAYQATRPDCKQGKNSPRSLARSLSGYSGLRVSGIWISYG